MRRAILSALLTLLSAVPLAAQVSSDEVSKALAQGDLYASRRKYDLALEAYHKADKLAHHASARCYLKMASAERKLGDFSSALDDAKRAVKVAGDDKTTALQGHFLRATLLTSLAGKPSDKKLKEAEEELRQALVLDPERPLAHYNLGMVLLRQERDTEGVAELTAFVNSAGADPGMVAKARRIIANPVRGREPFAPDFSLLTQESGMLTNASLRGKVVLFDFWGTWCPPCRVSVPTLHNLQKKYSGKAFQLVGVSSDDDESVWRTFIEAQKMDWAEYIDLSGAVLKAFEIESFPTYIVVDKDGVIRFRQSGFGEELTQAELEEAINKALKRPSDPRLAAAASTPEPAAPAAPATASSAGARASDVGESGASGGVTPTPLADEEMATITGNVYKNEELNLTYAFPLGWVAARQETLHTMNERSQAAIKASFLQQHPDYSGPLHFSVPRVVFYASRRGEGDGQRLSIPCVRISAVPTRAAHVNLDTFRQMTESMAVANGGKLLSPATEFTVKEHGFARADFEHNMGSTRVTHGYIRTVAADYLLTIEIFATSPAELQQIAATLQALVISDDP